MSFWAIGEKLVSATLRERWKWLFFTKYEVNVTVFTKKPLFFMCNLDVLAALLTFVHFSFSKKGKLPLIQIYQENPEILRLSVSSNAGSSLQGTSRMNTPSLWGSNSVSSWWIFKSRVPFYSELLKLIFKRSKVAHFLS